MHSGIRTEKWMKRTFSNKEVINDNGTRHCTLVVYHLLPIHERASLKNIRKLACAVLWRKQQQMWSNEQTNCERLFRFVSQMLKLQFISICETHIMTHNSLFFYCRWCCLSSFFVVSLIRSCVLLKYAEALSAIAGLLRC